jgi:U3 small nucleolar RNA-associated protein 19
VVVLKAAIKASCKVCCHLVSVHYTWLVPAGTKLSANTSGGTRVPVSPSNDDTTKKYREWMKQSYLACIERLLQLLCHSEPDIWWQCLTSLMKLVQAEGSTHQRLSHAYIFPNTFFHVVVSHLLDNEEDVSNLIGRFQEYLDYDDVRFYWLKNIA